MRELAREIAAWICTTYSLDRVDLRKFWIEDTRPGFYSWAHIYWQETGNAIGDSEVYQFAPPTYAGSAVQAPMIAAAAISLGIDAVYWFEDGSGFDQSMPADGDLVDDGLSVYPDNWIDRGQSAPRPLPNRGEFRENRFKILLPFYIPRTLDADILLRFYEAGFFELENLILSANITRQRQFLRELCREKTLITGGYETSAELRDLLINSRQILSLRGTPHGIISTAYNTSEVDRLFNSNDAEYDFIDGAWIWDETYADQIYMPGLYDTSFDLGDYLKISVTHNNMANVSIEQAYEILRRYIVPAEYILILDFK